MPEDTEAFKVKRLGLVIEPEPGNPNEVEGILNPGAVRGPDGQLYLFPRLVGKGNYSRIGIARVQFDSAGDPVGIERLGIALEPEADYELRPGGAGGCEDPRVSFVDTIQRYAMFYTAFSPSGPRIAVAHSKDLIHWERMGLVRYRPYKGLSLEDVDDKDASPFPDAVPDTRGHLAWAMLHRPLFPGTRPEEIVHRGRGRKINRRQESIWISYCNKIVDKEGNYILSQFTSHRRLAAPKFDWEHLKIGGGTPPVLTKHGWMILYHGVSEAATADPSGRSLVYSAGVMILAQENPHRVLYRSSSPVLKPELDSERIGAVGNVVFPTGIDQRSDIGMPNRYDVYYGMADDRIGVGRMDVPDSLPS